METIVIIDDKIHALKQITYAIGNKNVSRFSILHFYSFAQYKKYKPNNTKWLFLDYFLDIDRIPGTQIIPELDSQIFIGFSSMKETTEALLEAAILSGKWNKLTAFCFIKDKSKFENPELEVFFHNIIPEINDELGIYQIKQADHNREEIADNIFDFNITPEKWINQNADNFYCSSFDEYYYLDPYKTWWIHRIHRILGKKEKLII